MSKVVVYTMPGCPACAGVKAYLREKGVEFAEKDVLADEETMAEFRAAGYRGTPVTVVGDTAVTGLDKPRLDEALASLGQR